MRISCCKYILLFVLICLPISFSYWSTKVSKINFSKFADWISQTNSIVHFGNLWNDLWWLVFVTWQKSISWWVDISWINCLQQLKGYYSVWTMWLTLLPLDSETLNEFKALWLTSNLKLEWWLYTMCQWYQDSILWQVKLTTSTSTRYITSWVKINHTNNALIWWFTNAFQFYNKRPIWLVHDSLLWVWFIWGKVNKVWVDETWKSKQMSWFDFLVTQTNNWIKMNNLIQEITKDEIKIKNHLKETGNPPLFISNWLINSVLLKIWVLGSFNVSQSWIWKANFQEWSNSLSQVDSNNNYESFNMASSTNTQTSSVLNNIQKSTDLICRNKWINVTNTVTISSNWLHCYKSDWTYRVEVVSNLIQNKDSKTTIVLSWKWARLLFKKSQFWEWNLNVFVDQWFLMIDDGIDLVNVDESWKYTASPSYTKWAMLRWMFYVRWLITWYSSWNIWTFTHRMYFRWNVVSYNSIYEPTENMKTFLKTLLNNSNINDYINLQWIFTWSCSWTWLNSWSDWSNCWGQSKRASKSLVFIKDEIQSLFK